MSKPTVHFAGQAEFITFDYQGEEVTVARVYALDHPKLGQQNVRTSRVIERRDDGSFETMNTVYVPEAAQ